MSQIDFQNGFVVGMALGGKNGAVGGVAPNPNALKNMIIAATLSPVVGPSVGFGIVLLTPIPVTLTAV